ncbi:MAG: NAD-dependent epimerase/dehydratase family protein [Lachnospiraceae bacterium]|nr:NAD-dependent epimerase/dehydratase family protein [Lachnospiraceae bacterium]
MNIVLFGGAGFIGTNLVFELAKNTDNHIIVVDRNEEFFAFFESKGLSNVKCVQATLSEQDDFDSLLSGGDVVYHLVSTTVPTTSNQHIAEELRYNMMYSAALLEACVRRNIKRVVFFSSGGTVYGKEVKCPLGENTSTNPITSYGVQKLVTEKLLYLYHYMHGLDYRIIRLTNPYGPYQRPNGVLGAITTFTYKALKNEEIAVYGDGSVVRDFIYIDDAIRGIINVAEGDSDQRIFNLGCGYGTSILKVLETIGKVLNTELKVKFLEGRKVDVPVNYLDISQYESTYGKLNPIGLEEGIRKTADFLRMFYSI